MGDKGAEKPVDAKVIKKTQDTLGKIIKKPPLTDKLLQKPPFRFLHDIVTSVIKQTGFMKGLFTEAEMNSENVKERDAKTAFLQKVIDMVSLVLGKPIAAKPSKIVAGHDADRTNELLQALSEAINKKIDNDDYVRRVLKADDSADSKPPPARKESSKDSSAKDSSKSQSKDKEESSKKSRDDGDEKEKSGGDRHKSRERHRDRDEDDAGRSKETKRDGKDREEKSRRSTTDTGDEKSRGDHSRRGDQRSERKEKRDDSVDDSNEQKLQRPTSAKGSRRHQSRGEDDSKKENRLNADNDDSRSTKKQSVRPSSARPAPPKPKKADAITDDVAAMGGRKVPNVIVDKKGKSDDEDEEENDDLLNADTDIGRGRNDSAAHKRPELNGDAEDDDNHGGLVKKMLETKKEAEQQPGKKTEIDRSQAMSDATRRKEREVIQRDIDRLRTSVQTLTRSVNPLGKILDFVQEDLDAMQKEVEVWRNENHENVIALQREQSVTESSIEPLKAQLTELDAAIRDQLDLIAAVKSTILHNDLKITKMLGSVTKS